jgi:hypothetical protein
LKCDYPGTMTDEIEARAWADARDAAKPRG